MKVKKLLPEELITANLNGKRFAIEKNGEIISKNYFVIYFDDGDKIEIIGAVGGG